MSPLSNLHMLNIWISLEQKFWHLCLRSLCFTSLWQAGLSFYTRYSREAPFIALNVDIRNHQSLLDSMEQFVKGDLLEGANAYHCEKCDKKVIISFPKDFFRIYFQYILWCSWEICMHLVERCRANTVEPHK